MIDVVMVGAGAVVELLYWAPLKKLEKAGYLRVSAVADVDEERANRTARQFRNARSFSDLEHALSGMAFDLAIIASPPALHAQHAIIAFEHGCHVLCEKPMSTTPADAAKMNHASARANKSLAIAFPRRFWPNIADAAKLIADGEIGEDLTFTYREGRTFRWPITSDTAFRRDASRGGALLDMGVHLLDVLSWIFGGPAVVQRACDDSLEGGVETNARVELALPRARGVMQVSWEYPLKNALRIRGSGGELMLEGELTSYRRRTAAGWMRVPAITDWPSDMKQVAGRRLRPGTVVESFEVQFISMLRSITYGEPFPVNGLRAAALQQTIEETYRISEPLDPRWLSESERIVAQARHWSRGHHGG